MARTFVPPSGPLDAKIIICGEQPGRNEAYYSHKPFTGPAGKNLDECLQAAGINRHECYFTNVIKDFDGPLSDYITFTTVKKFPLGVFTLKGQRYVEMLEDEIRNIMPNIIIGCGNVSLWSLTSRVGISNWRGSILDSTLAPGIKVIPTFHPATWTLEKLYSNPGAFLNKYSVINDLKKAKKESEFRGIKEEYRETKIKPLYPEVLEFLSFCTFCAEQGDTINYDIELVPGTQEISCISFAPSPKVSMCIPFIDKDGDYFGIEQEANIMLQIAKLLENPLLKKGGQYIIFDSHLMYRKFGIIARNLDDTFIAQKILYPELPAGLDFITSVWTDMPYYKKDGKIWLGGIGTWEQGWIYNDKDSLSCAEALPKQLMALDNAGNIAAYERQKKLIEPLTYMMEHGIRVNLKGMEDARYDNNMKAEELIEQVNRIIGEEINLASPQQLMEYFYIKKGIKPYINSNTQKPTVDITALKRLASTHGLKEASLILEIRQLEKLNSTFLSPEKVDSDGRIRCAYNPAGTKFSRISSTENIFGTGINLQNVPHSALSYLIADQGYAVYELDYSQYENRVVAYVGNIIPMIEAFENGDDLHKLTAAMVRTAMGNPTRIDEVSPYDRQNLGKISNHAFNYDWGPNSFALKHELPVSIGKAIHKAYHQAYPGVRGGYHTYVQQCLRKDRTLTNLMDRKVTFLGQWGDVLLKSAYSCIPQGSCGDCINERAINFTYYNEDPLFKSVEILTQIHDSMAIQIPLSVPLIDHARIILKIKESMEQPLHFGPRNFIPPVDLIINNCLNKERGKELKAKEISSDPQAFAKMLDVKLDELSLTYDD